MQRFPLTSPFVGNFLSFIIYKIGLIPKNGSVAEPGLVTNRTRSGSN